MANIKEQALDLLLTLVQNTRDNHWDMAACVCLVCELARHLDIKPREIPWGSPSLRYQRWKLEAISPELQSHFALMMIEAERNKATAIGRSAGG